MAVLLLSVLFAPGSHANSTPEAEETPQQPLPLIENIRDMHCAADASSARLALYRLQKNINPDSGLPDEWEGQQKRSQLHAGTLDLAVETTVKTIQKFPDLTTLGESVLLQWNYCEVFHNGIPYDLRHDRSDVQKQQAEYLPPGAWNGLSRLGLGETGIKRYIPEAFSNTATTTRGHLLYNWWNLQRYQCLPHPGNGQMFHRKQYVPRARVNTAQTIIHKEYPVAWSDDCSVPFTRGEHEALARELAEKEAIRLAQQRAHRADILLSHKDSERQHYLDHLHDQAIARQQQLLTIAAHARDKANSLPLIGETNIPEPNSEPTEQVAAQTTGEQNQNPAAPADGTAVTASDATAPVPDSSGDTQVADNTTTPQQATTADAANKPTAGQTDNPESKVADNSKASPATQQPVAKADKPPEKPQLTAQEAARNAKQIAERVATYRKQILNQDKIDTQEMIDLLQPAQPIAKPSQINTEIPELAAALPPADEENAPNPLQGEASSVPPFKPEEKPKKERLYHGFSGSIALSNRKFETDAWSLTTNFSYKPIIASYYFARTGFTFTDADEPVSYYWGIGYNDWHTNTWAFELNNWGPLTPGDGLKLEKSIASVSYKFESKFLQKYNLSSSLTLSASQNNSPSLTLATSWTPKPKWFVRNIFNQSLEGGGVTWAYGFGFSDYRANTFSLEYNNWGPNTFSEPNFTDNALVTLSWKWNL